MAALGSHMLGHGATHLSPLFPSPQSRRVPLLESEWGGAACGPTLGRTLDKIVGTGVREGEMLSPVLEPRERKAARWEIEVVKQPVWGQRRRVGASWPLRGGEEGARVCISEPAEITKQREEQGMLSI